MTEAAREGIRAPRPCVSYGPGHTVHHIQANHAVRDPDTKVPGRVVEITDAIVVDVDGELRRFHNHELDRARDLLAVMGPEVAVQTRWGLLWFGSYLVCVTEKGPLGPCPTDGLPDHGFVVRVGPGEAPTREQLEELVRRVVPDDEEVPR